MSTKEDDIPDLDHAVDHLADLIAEGMKPRYDSRMRPFSLFQEELRVKLYDNVSLFERRMTHGYRVVLDEAITHKADLNKLIPKESNETAWEKKLGQGALLANVMGFSNEALRAFYDYAKELLEAKRGEDAADAFFFLSVLRPDMAPFWQGMARGEELNHQLPMALGCYQMALIMDGSEPSRYLEAARCCVQMHDYEQGMSILDQAIAYADKHPDAKTAAKLRDCAVKGKRNIQDIQARRR